MTIKKLTCGALIGVGILVVLLLVACAYYAGKGHFGTGHHRYGSRHDSAMMSEGSLHKLSRKLDLDDAQRATLFSAGDDVRLAFKEMHQQMHESRKAMRALDPRAAGYDAEIAELATKQGRIVSQKIVMFAAMKSQFADILNEQQMQKLMKILERRRHH